MWSMFLVPAVLVDVSLIIVDKQDVRGLVDLSRSHAVDSWEGQSLQQHWR